MQFGQIKQHIGDFNLDMARAFKRQDIIGLAPNGYRRPRRPRRPLNYFTRDALPPQIFSFQVGCNNQRALHRNPSCYSDITNNPGTRCARIRVISSNNSPP